MVVPCTMHLYYLPTTLLYMLCQGVTLFTDGSTHERDSTGHTATSNLRN